MSGTAVKLPLALQDLDDAAAYIQRHSSPTRAIRFLQAADSTIAMLASMPGMGARYKPLEPAYADLRFFPVARHRKYLVFYKPLPDGVVVVRELHGARSIPEALAEEFGP
ncbi:MAG: type II toxin-antitoxin system RelE/ParE family toxin [Paludisphaera borealis]|uniref:type II toxin-antitoxin system RelE/ParE family toxin n=1 Tax=Paludisphaera borealis TaxID=1387353 RepID=UPI00284CD9A3|nr:type II toxin-antitoxin system RelE/ParE family toxin [Paludisphaera borealis]MDR3619657.1 type II toxin-antitoxin system RelE/ParE family toxin [Paludisphaera borealis]